MKVVKLNRTHKLFRFGYTYALRFPRRNMEALKVIDGLTQAFGADKTVWKVYRSDKKRPFWIGFKEESMITMALMIK